MNLRAGFTLFELIIVIGLFAISASMIVFSIRGQRSETGLSSEVESFVLAVEETKSRARTASSRFLGSGELANEHRGIYFGSTSGVFDDIVVSYADLAASTSEFFYDGPSEDTIIQELILADAFIQQVCGGTIQVGGSLSWNCVSSADISGVHVVFSRSDETPRVKINGTVYSAIRIDLSRDDNIRYIYVDTSGNVFSSKTLFSL